MGTAGPAPPMYVPHVCPPFAAHPTQHAVKHLPRTLAEIVWRGNYFDLIGSAIHHAYVVWCGVVWCGVVWCDAMWLDMM